MPIPDFPKLQRVTFIRWRDLVGDLPDADFDAMGEHVLHLRAPEAEVASTLIHPRALDDFLNKAEPSPVLDLVRARIRAWADTKTLIDLES